MKNFKIAMMCGALLAANASANAFMDKMKNVMGSPVAHTLVLGAENVGVNRTNGNWNKGLRCAQKVTSGTLGYLLKQQPGEITKRKMAASVLLALGAFGLDPVLNRYVDFSRKQNWTKHMSPVLFDMASGLLAFSAGCTLR